MISAIAAFLLIGANPDAPPSTASPEPKAAKEKKVCKEDPAYTGSRMAKKLCLTPTQWEQRETGKSTADLKSMGAR